MRNPIDMNDLCPNCRKPPYIPTRLPQGTEQYEFMLFRRPATTTAPTPRRGLLQVNRAQQLHAAKVTDSERIFVYTVQLYTYTDN